jgi:hypothetical protein
MNSFNRRQMLQTAGAGFGMLALAGLANAKSASAADLTPHHRPRAKRIIFLFMHGGPSQVDTFDHKPRLAKENGQKLPFNAAPNVESSTAQLKIMQSPWKFAQHGESGLWVSELFPHISQHMDDLCVVKSLHSKGQSHGQAVCMLHTGSDSLVRPSVGSWLSYGLGSANQDLPAFVSITPPKGHGGPRNYGSGFLPAINQATTIGYSTQPVKNAKIQFLESQVPVEEQRRQLVLVQQLNKQHLENAQHDEQIEGMIKSYELAFRMQAAVPPVMDLSKENKATQQLYGIGKEPTDNFGRCCLMARRFAESGVRFIQVSAKQNSWDQHSNLKSGHERNCGQVDQPIAGLLTDLKQRGLLDDTLVLWGGEFGRTPIAQGTNGRDHNPQGFSMWLAGGGVKGGISYGNTDEYGYYAVEDKVHIHDLHATLLHLAGLNHERLTYRYAGRDFRLTDVYGRVVDEIIS